MKVAKRRQHTKDSQDSNTGRHNAWPTDLNAIALKYVVSCRQVHKEKNENGNENENENAEHVHNWEIVAYKKKEYRMLHPHSNRIDLNRFESNSIASKTVLAISFHLLKVLRRMCYVDRSRSCSCSLALGVHKCRPFLASFVCLPRQTTGKFSVFLCISKMGEFM